MGEDEFKTCGLKMVHHFSNNTAMIKGKIAALTSPMSSTFTAKALEMANAELMLGRKDARRVVLVVTDGIPISPRLTGIAAKKLRLRARLMFAAVRLNREGMGWMQKWAS